MERKWTKGPWHWSTPASSICPGKLLGAENVPIYRAEPNGQASITIPDAHLIAAAPDLYEALEACAETLSRMHNIGGFYGLAILDNARAALARARGEA